MATVIPLTDPVAATMENLYEDGLDIKVIISNLVDDLNIEEFWSELRTGSWCLVNPPVQGLPWLALAHQVAALDELKFGWINSLGLEILSGQLVGLSQRCTELKLHFNAELQKYIPLIYSSLQEYIDTDDLQFLKTSLNGVHGVWVGDEFVAPDALAFDSPVKFSPYLYDVPSKL
ncbi:Hypothetical predicted protein [Olea europaea subsp. europaea]|uniref:Uncharacterized protein n=1 Tax=Olea europaea subsp. europaea TaxID=158383 RepID=A0A8S0PKT3_OLEEU|nr:Hypothetical predicted protein [Olea europaea subsp. europaea]